MGSILRGGDKRWAMPSKAETEALTPDAFRKTWEPLLKQGQIELLVFGDGKREDVIAAIAKTIGALPKRSDSRIAHANATSKGPVATSKPVILHHKGPVDQAAAMIAFPTSGGIEAIYESRKLELLSAIFNDRMFDRFREAEGQSYSPSVSSNWPIGMNNGGSFVVAATLKPEGVDRFFALSKEIAADLAAKPPTADEFARASGPMIETLNRASSGNTFWMVQMAGATRDPRRIDALKSLMTDYRRITAADIQQAAKMWLVPRHQWWLFCPASNPLADRIGTTESSVRIWGRCS
jgi:zinc protease